MTKYLGKITTLAVASTTVDPSHNMVVVGQVKELMGYQPTVDALETTEYGTDYEREYGSGIRTGGNIDFVLFYDGGTSADASLNYLGGLLHAAPDANERLYRITLPAGETLWFKAIVIALTIDPVLDDYATASVTLNLTGGLESYSTFV